MGKTILRIASAAMFWGACLLFLPIALFRVYFDPLFLVAAAAFFLALRHGLPRVFKHVKPLSLKITVLLTELFLFAVGVQYYMSDTRGRECGFALDKRLKPLVTFRQCMGPDTARRDMCEAIATNPYGLAAYRNDLLTVSGLHESTLGRIPLTGRAPYTAVPVGGGNAQQIAVDPARGLAVLPLWRTPAILLYDLNRNRVLRSFATHRAQLIGAEKNGDTIYVIGEGLGLYTLDLNTDRLTRHPLPYRTHRLYDIQLDPGRGHLYLSDWIWGVVYQLRDGDMAPLRHRVLFGMAGAMALDRTRCELYVARMLYGRIDVLDCATLRTVRRLRAGRGAHEMALSPDSNSLYVVIYFDGTFMEIDRFTGRRLDSFAVGRQTRALYLDPRTGRLFLASKCGVYEVVR